VSSGAESTQKLQATASASGPRRGGGVVEGNRRGRVGWPRPRASLQLAPISMARSGASANNDRVAATSSALSLIPEARSSQCGIRRRPAWPATSSRPAQVGLQKDVGDWPLVPLGRVDRGPQPRLGIVLADEFVPVAGVLAAVAEDVVAADWDDRWAASAGSAGAADGLGGLANEDRARPAQCSLPSARRGWRSGTFSTVGLDSRSARPGSQVARVIGHPMAKALFLDQGVGRRRVLDDL
jgi:hypothetical protein